MKPDQVSGLKLWLQADDLNTLADGGDVISWVDKSVNAIDFTGASFFPVLKKNIIRGHSIVRFSHGKTLDSSYNVADVFSDNKCSWFAVIRTNNDADGDTIFYDISNTPKVGLYIPFSSEAFFDFGLTYDSGNPGRLTDSVSNFSGTFHIVEARLLDDGTQDILVDGISLGSQIWNGTPQLSGATTSILTLGTDNPGGNGDDLDGDIAEIILYNRDIGPIAYAGIYKYLHKRYFESSVASLPSGRVEFIPPQDGVANTRVLIRIYRGTLLSHEREVYSGFWNGDQTLPCAPYGDQWYLVDTDGDGVLSIDISQPGKFQDGH